MSEDNERPWTARYGDPVEPLEARIERARARCGREDVSVLRAIVQNWRSGEEVVLAAPRPMAEQILVALDALCIALGLEDEAARIDEILGRVMGGGPRP